VEDEAVREIILKELPALVMRDSQIRDWVWRLIHDYAPSREETENRFDRALAELRAMREESERKWEENVRQWRENERKWEENVRQWRENERKWEENERKWEENERKWEENVRQWRENERKWEENQRQIRVLMAKIEQSDRRIERTLGALGARWGLSSEVAFRNALRGILEESFGVNVEHVEYRDESGEVFGRPDQVELDVIIRNGQMLVCELKSSASRSDVYIFERKVRSYEKRVGRKADRLLLISPMVEEKGKATAAALGIEVYSDAEDVVP